MKTTTTILIAALLCTGCSKSQETFTPSTPPPPPPSNPDFADFPFAPEQIREATAVGRTYEWRVEAEGKPPMRRRVKFTAVSNDGADTESVMLDDAGKPVEPPKHEHVTWDELHRHAAFPFTATTIHEETITTPSGTYDCRVYDVKNGDEVDRYYFSKKLPGAPVLFWKEKSGKRVMTSTLVAYSHGTSATPPVTASTASPAR